MTLYELANSTIIQGDIELAVFDEHDNETRRELVELVDDLSFELFHSDLLGLEDLNVKYIFTRIVDSEARIIIELDGEYHEF